jgi:hypothetical protein
MNLVYLQSKKRGFMRIYGDTANATFSAANLDQERGITCGLFGYNEVLLGEIDKDASVQPKLYIHRSNGIWSKFTAILREYCLPWRWKVVYLDQQDTTPLKRILVCTNVQNGELSDRLKELLGRSLFIASLIYTSCYKETDGKECLLASRSSLTPQELGPRNFDPYHIYRARGVASFFKYYFLKCFSEDWQEEQITITKHTGKVLIQRKDREVLADAGFIKKPPTKPVTLGSSSNLKGSI